MVDTIILSFEKPQFEITAHELFTPSAAALFAAPFHLGSHGQARCYQNPSKTDLKKGLYKPRLTLIKRGVAGGGYSLVLRVECSLPKLLFGNNFDELDERCFDRVITALEQNLAAMGVRVLPQAIKTCAVSAIHFSKNLILPSHLTSATCLQEISKLNAIQRLDLNKTDFRNGGHALRFHANSYEFVIYDKIKDLEQSKISPKRCLETNSKVQLRLLKDGMLTNKLQVIRFELRFTGRVKLKKLLKELGIRSDLTLQSLFVAALSKQLLLHFWDQLTKNANLLGVNVNRPDNLFTALHVANNLKPGKALRCLGALIVVNEVGFRGLRLLMRDSSPASWQSIRKDLQGVNLNGVPRHRIFSELRKSLFDFLPIFLDSYKIIEGH